MDYCFFVYYYSINILLKVIISKLDINYQDESTLLFVGHIILILFSLIEFTAAQIPLRMSFANYTIKERILLISKY